MSVGFVTPVGVRWSDIDMYQHVNHATMVTILEEARVPFLKDAFGADITSTGLLIADVRVTYKGQLRLSDSPLQVTIWTKRLRAVDFTLGYEVRSVNAEPDSRPAVIGRVAAGRVPYRGTAVGSTIATPSRVPATVVSGIGGVVERGLWLPDPAHRADLATFVDHALRLDDAAVIRIRARSTGLLSAWVATGFDVLASRVVAGKVRPDDLSVAARSLAHGLATTDASGYVDPGYSMDSAWRGGLPPESGFTYLDDVPARVMLDLAHRGARLAKEHGSSAGPPVSLLDQEVIQVSSADVVVGLPMRCVFALTAMGFLPQSAETISADELIRVRISPAWLRLDARFGSVYRHRGHAALVLR